MSQLWISKKGETHELWTFPVQEFKEKSKRAEAVYPITDSGADVQLTYVQLAEKDLVGAQGFLKGLFRMCEFKQGDKVEWDVKRKEREKALMTIVGDDEKTFTFTPITKFRYVKHQGHHKEEYLVFDEEEWESVAHFEVWHRLNECRDMDIPRFLVADALGISIDSLAIFWPTSKRFDPAMYSDDESEAIGRHVAIHCEPRERLSFVMKWDDEYKKENGFVVIPSVETVRNRLRMLI